MKVLLNTAPLVKGGTLQSSSAFIAEALRDPAGIDWHVATSAPIVAQLNRLGVKLPADTTVFEKSPARSRTQRRRLLEMERRLAPDCVLTYSGPTFVKFRAPHVVGCSDSWTINATALARRVLSPAERIFYRLIAAYKIHWLRFADAWITQTEATRIALHKKTGAPLDRIVIIPNSCADHYRGRDTARAFPTNGECIRLLCFSAAYKHKNLDLLPRVAEHLERLLPGRDFRFVVTLPETHSLTRDLMSDFERSGLSHRIENRGPVPVADGPALYSQCHVCFLPTLLETFSATYVEAMAMGIPVVTTNLDFAHSVCRDAALYFQPLDAADAASTLARLITSPKAWDEIVERGKRIPAELPTARQRFLAYVSIVRAVVEGRPLVPSYEG